MSIDLNIIGKNKLNLEIYKRIRQSVKTEAILTNKLTLKDYDSAFNRIEKHQPIITTIMCHPSMINIIKQSSKEGKNIPFIENICPPCLTKDEIINSSFYGIVGWLWIAKIRICNAVKNNVIWVSSCIPEDSLFADMTKEDMFEIGKIAKDLLDKLAIPLGIPADVIFKDIRESFKENDIDDDLIISCPIILENKDNK